MGVSLEKLQTPCRCPKSKLCKCDGQCDLCEFYFPEELSLDSPISDDDRDATLADYIPDTSANIEDIVADRMLLEELFEKLRELTPDADEMINLWK